MKKINETTYSSWWMKVTSGNNMKKYFNSRNPEWQETKWLIFKAMKHLFDNEWLSSSKSYRLVALQITDIKVWIKVLWKKVFQTDIPSENRVYDWIKDEQDEFHYFKLNKPWSKKKTKQIEI
jgi:hypothetical protein